MDPIVRTMAVTAARALLVAFLHVPSASVLVIGTSSGCDDACNSAGCSLPSALFSAPLFAVQNGDSITILTCHNTTCDQADVTLPTMCDGWCDAWCDLDNADVQCSVDQNAGGWKIKLSYNVRAKETYAADGDAYYVRVTRTATDEVLVHELDVVAYEEYELCGGNASCAEVTHGPFAPGGCSLKGGC